MFLLGRRKGQGRKAGQRVHICCLLKRFWEAII
jgi:hypothetical protein